MISNSDRPRVISIINGAVTACQQDSNISEAEAAVCWYSGQFTTWFPIAVIAARGDITSQSR